MNRIDNIPEINRLLLTGVRRITKDSLIQKLHEIGYKIDDEMCHTYINSSNENVYKAKSINYKHIESGLGWANICCDKTNLPLLQQIRLDYFCVENGRIWEL